MKTSRINDIHSRLKSIEAEKKKLIDELISLQTNNKDLPAVKGINANDKTPETPPDKISLFLKLVRLPKMLCNSDSISQVQISCSSGNGKSAQQ